MRIDIARTPATIERCFDVMHALRTHLERESFVARVQMQQSEGYRLAYLEDSGVVEAVAGFRIHSCLLYGRMMYVDDLVTREGSRSKGHGGQLFDWLVAEARRERCEQFELDSGVHRFAAHRFYLTKRMSISSHHFALKLE